MKKGLIHFGKDFWDLQFFLVLSASFKEASTIWEGQNLSIPLSPYKICPRENAGH